MKITNVRINQLVGEGKVRALASVVFDGVLTVTDLRVVEGSKGIFVSMPSRKNKDGKYRDIVYPCTAEMRQAIQSAVIGAYNAMVKSEVSAQAEERSGLEETLAPAPQAAYGEGELPWVSGEECAAAPQEGADARELVAVGGEARLVG